MNDPGALTTSERDAVLADLGHLLEAVGLGDHARPESPHEVFQMALAEVGRIGERAAAAERERIRWLAIRKRAVYCKACDGGPCGYEDELASFADLIGEEA